MPIHTDKSSLGSLGETFTQNYLQRNGFKILAANYRKPFGEIDLIAQKGEFVCFIEVKTRKTELFPTSLVVTKQKQRRIIRTALSFTLSNRIKDKILRFDVAIVTGSPEKFSLRYLENAFTQDEALRY